MLLLSHKKKKKCQGQLFLSSVVELLQESFSNIFSAPLKETCCAGERWGGHAEPWLGKGQPAPTRSWGWCLNWHSVAAIEFTPLPFQGQSQPFSPLPDLCISALTCLQSELSPFLWLHPCPVPTMLPSSPKNCI